MTHANISVDNCGTISKSYENILFFSKEKYLGPVGVVLSIISAIFLDFFSIVDDAEVSYRVSSKGYCISESIFTCETPCIDKASIYHLVNRWSATARWEIFI